MTTKIIVTLKQLVDFVKSKGDARLDMTNNMIGLMNSKSCGCLFVEYVRANQKDTVTISAGFSTARVMLLDRTYIEYLFPIDYDSWCASKKTSELPKTFSELKVPA